MNSVKIPLKTVKPWLKRAPVLMTGLRNHWYQYYKPGPYPITEEKRINAAKKYELHPSEYEPYVDDGEGYGDYPKLPLISYENKDPFYPWDVPELKKNFKEPLHADFDLLREDRYDINYKNLNFPLWIYWAQFFGVLAGFFSIYLTAESFKMFHPVIPKQMPAKGRQHYTFEKD
ncbi:NADH dehydrogenase [ubiquinone] 1 beta subcomplex subunit 8, mitochondrial [Cylas formicarius]|uniref:NADH dehydrogenase [ubiquinone] 1 beta subcomplex subunit 8, mitochondrial n=1 Tax=Cylas formicarius TaxID=197179 RepID=UPI0029586D7A|nr:NADH dehydrogenase [ubiquinone] 1 beta subcomplex subunit 8, mitochondrial [Cylas formicarius]